MTINVGEYGLALNLNVNYDLSSALSLQISIVRPDDSIILGTPIMGTSYLVTLDQGTFLANQYATYLIQPGDLTLPGTYRIRLTYTDASKRLVSDVTSFDVYS